MILHRIAAFVAAAASSVLLGMWIVPLANAQRDVPGVGGEWILVVATFCVVFGILWPEQSSKKRSKRK